MYFVCVYLVFDGRLDVCLFVRAITKWAIFRVLAIAKPIVTGLLNLKANGPDRTENGIQNDEMHPNKKPVNSYLNLIL